MGHSLGPVGAPAGATLHAHNGTISSVAFSRDGTRIFTVGSDGALRVWGASDLTVPLQERLHAHSGAISSVAVSANGRIATVGGDRLEEAGGDRALRVWDAASDLSSFLVEKLDAHSGDILSVAFSPHDARLATVGCDSAVRVWDGASSILTSPLLEKFDAHAGSIRSAAFSPDGARLTTVGN